MLGGKTILVTGASRGIGAALAAALSGAGARVIAHASRPGPEADAAAGRANIAAGDFLYEDLSSKRAGTRLVERAIARAGRLDAAVNNAAIAIASPIASGDDAWDETWRSTFAINVKAPADICRAAIAHFRAKGGGRIVNIASRAGHRGDRLDFAAYAASKGALLAMTKTFARALAGEGIYVYAIAPGWVETRMAPEDVAARAAAVAEIPLGRVAAPEEVAALAAFLLTDACVSATGSTFDINGASYVR